jgi:probable rRNA maturation factor
MIVAERAVGTTAETQLNRFARRAKRLAGVSGEVAVLITGNRRIRSLNRRFRKKNKPADVLSFPRDGGGDIAISAEVAGENARRLGHTLEEEIKILILHGMLHLAGYDHETDGGEMAAREAALRAQLKLPLSLTERGPEMASKDPKLGRWQ